MNEFNFKLKRCYSFYTSEVHDGFITVSEYDSNGKVRRERPISKKELEIIGRTAVNSNTTNCIVNPKSVKYLILFNQFPFHLVWIVPKSERIVLTTSGEVKINAPDMIFEVKADKLMVYCFKKKKDQYYLAKCPYPNVMDDHVCLGNIKTGNTKQLLSDEMKRWESLFFDTTFTGANFTIPSGLNYQLHKFE